MKPGGPLKRHKQLARGAGPVRRKPMPARQTRIAHRSKKMRDLYERPGGRRDLVARLLEERPWCEARITGRCSGRSVDVHEKASRGRGGDILDVDILLTVCRGCHEWITNHPKEAELMGLSIWSWDYDRHDPVG